MKLERLRLRKRNPPSHDTDSPQGTVPTGLLEHEHVQQKDSLEPLLLNDPTPPSHTKQPQSAEEHEQHADDTHSSRGGKAPTRRSTRKKNTSNQFDDNLFNYSRSDDSQDSDPEYNGNQSKGNSGKRATKEGSSPPPKRKQTATRTKQQLSQKTEGTNYSDRERIAKKRPLAANKSHEADNGGDSDSELPLVEFAIPATTDLSKAKHDDTSRVDLSQEPAETSDQNELSVNSKFFPAASSNSNATRYNYDSDTEKNSALEQTYADNDPFDFQVDDEDENVTTQTRQHPKSNQRKRGGNKAPRSNSRSNQAKAHILPSVSDHNAAKTLHDSHNSTRPVVLLESGASSLPTMSPLKQRQPQELDDRHDILITEQEYENSLYTDTAITHHNETDSELEPMQNFSSHEDHSLSALDKTTEATDKHEQPQTEPYHLVEDDEASLALARQLAADDSEPYDICDVCGDSLSQHTPIGREKHINTCLDNQQNIKALPSECPLCNHPTRATVFFKHIKSCARNRSVPLPAVLEIVKAIQADSPNTLRSNTQFSAASSSSSNQKASTRSSASKTLVPRVRDPELELARALSASMAEPKRSTHATRFPGLRIRECRAPDRRLGETAIAARINFRSLPKESPPMSSMSKEELLQQRLSMVLLGPTSPTKPAISTPAFPPSQIERARHPQKEATTQFPWVSLASAKNIAPCEYDDSSFELQLDALKTQCRDALHRTEIGREIAKQSLPATSVPNTQKIEEAATNLLNELAVTAREYSSQSSKSASQQSIQDEQGSHRDLAATPTSIASGGFVPSPMNPLKAEHAATIAQIKEYYEKKIEFLRAKCERKIARANRQFSERIRQLKQQGQLDDDDDNNDGQQTTKSMEQDDQDIENDNFVAQLPFDFGNDMDDDDFDVIESGRVVVTEHLEDQQNHPHILDQATHLNDLTNNQTGGQFDLSTDNDVPQDEVDEFVLKQASQVAMIYISDDDHNDNDQVFDSVSTLQKSVDLVTPRLIPAQSPRITGSTPNYMKMPQSEIKIVCQKYGLRPTIDRNEMVRHLTKIWRAEHEKAAKDSVSEEYPSDDDDDDENDGDMANSDSDVDDEEELPETSQFVNLNTSLTKPSESAAVSKPKAKPRKRKQTKAIETSSSASSEQLMNALHNYIQSNKELYIRILTYEPILFEDLINQVKAIPLKCTKKDLATYLDNQGVVYVLPHESGPRIRRRKRKRK